VPRLQLNVKNLNELDKGKASAAFLHAIRMAAQDVIDQPGDKAKRKATLLVELAPILDKESLALKHIGASFKISTSVPDRTTLQYPMAYTNDGILHFQSLSPQDPEQMDLPGLGVVGEAVAQSERLETGERVDRGTGEVLEDGPGDDDDERPEVERL
jgi:hypothetical protein